MCDQDMVGTLLYIIKGLLEFVHNYEMTCIVHVYRKVDNFLYAHINN